VPAGEGEGEGEGALAVVGEGDEGAAGDLSKALGDGNEALVVPEPAYSDWTDAYVSCSANCLVGTRTRRCANAHSPHCRTAHCTLQVYAACAGAIGACSVILAGCTSKTLLLAFQGVNQFDQVGAGVGAGVEEQFDQWEKGVEEQGLSHEQLPLCATLTTATVWFSQH
jgi:hypothetical protein